jgi:hypothetical protein
MENANITDLNRKADSIKNEFDEIKSILVEIMGDEDISDLKEALREYKEGKTVSVDSL